MSFQRRVKYFLVHALRLSNKQAGELIEQGKVEVAGQIISDNCLITENSEIKVNGKVERGATTFVYLSFYKPAGYESTLNANVSNSLAGFFSGYQSLSIAGRLDKASEGLLLLSNDGKWVEQLCNPKFEKEKEYFVTLDKPPSVEFLKTISKGVMIGNRKTLPCECDIVEHNTIKIILKEGLNRQIRRMCRNQGYEVLQLKRTRIGEVLLGGLKEGEISEID